MYVFLTQGVSTLGSGAWNLVNAQQILVLLLLGKLRNFPEGQWQVPQRNGGGRGEGYITHWRRRLRKWKPNRGDIGGS